MSNPSISGDDTGRAWDRARFHDTPAAEESCLLTLITADDDGTILVLGNAFIVSPQGSAAICMTAAHCFAEAQKHQRARTVRPHPTLPIDFRAKVTEYIKADEITAVYLAPNGPVCCRIVDVNYIENYDGAVCTVSAPESQNLFARNLAIDLAMPRLGERVGVLAHRIEVENKGNGEAVISRAVDLTIGTVTAIHNEVSRLGPMFYFETTIPLRPGISGSPIVKNPTPGGIVAACGIASSDFSTETSFSNFSEPGQSTASMIWPAMGFGFKVRQLGQVASAFTFLAELVARGDINDRSGGVSVVTRHDPTGTEIIYSDARAGPPIQFVLRTPPHPLAPTRPTEA